ncbi:uncharacterized protein Z518_09605 [Rhinocladiella mackenziei CBS 650.93]|uniref:Methyltransferase domain-containing protein n=1 Tax=Rhinocladiella mackenziei CBS 650.93 TaxID=1442369 RepID=A0A0D2GU85_9EURO|nr:uncharacterized protein Z518_09605 [Rhinocladiella mackenziei CBS 650.93]KIX01878.1 hypothetical protein Z518_09605 [Rhinocladiella mackenziei CBS 650.93]
MSQMRLDSVRSMYDERSEQYDENTVHVRQAQDYLEWAQLKRGESVLDLGWGTGLVTLGAKRAVGESGHVVGIDISEGMLNVASRKAAAAGLEITFINHDISDLSSPEILPKFSRSFDVITFGIVPGGRLVTDVQTKDANLVMNIFAAIAPEVGESVPWDAHRWHSPQALEDLMVEAGLKVDKIWETGSYATTQYDPATASQIYEQAVSKSMFKNFGRDEIREKTKGLFVDRLAELAGAYGFNC